ncbi:aldose epimerase family protein [Carboxylicivirga marina]|uniref:Aldose 1-epimerase n=1 Tax=Carboxylicivirga marina TaxID=2800988 RepID=A0ABS1HHC8_9BACT|nr:aldose epimerase family protein [Carboxylicivirga marina]MBK3517089.1 galactose mutarotase [Carboxylicivirga marina]
MKLINTLQLYQFLWIVILFILSGCATNRTEVLQEVWGEVKDKQVYLFTITNSNGMVMKVTNYGGIITSVLVPDKNGIMEDVVLGFDNLQQYIAPNPYFGAVIGRFANRISNGQFSIKDSVYQLSKNKGEHCLHGADEFNSIVWDSEIVENELGKGIRLLYLSKDGINGFPGNLNVVLTYTLTADNAIHIRCEAETDKATHANMTQHSYFNLTGGTELIYDHRIKIDANYYVEVDEQMIPTGNISSVKGKSWDLSSMTRIGDNIHQLAPKGYDHCYVLNKKEDELTKVLEVLEPKKGRTLKVSTTQPGVQLYTGNYISSKIVGKNGIQYKPHMGFCLETQHFPDSPNHPNFPSTLLLPGEKYEEVVIYDFGVFDK